MKIEDFANMSDEEIGNLLGFPAKIKYMRELMARASKLDADAKKRIQKRLDDMLTPRADPDFLSYEVERGEREMKKTGKEVADDDSPSSVLDD